jgi:hypothetical protein
MKFLVTGASVANWEMKDERTGQVLRGRSGKISGVRVKPSGKEGFVGREAGTFKAEGPIADACVEAMKRARGAFVVFDLDMDVKGTGENVKGFVADGEYVGILGQDVTLRDDGAVGPVTQPAPASAASAPAVPRAATSVRPVPVGA